MHLPRLFALSTLSLGAQSMVLNPVQQAHPRDSAPGSANASPSAQSLKRREVLSPDDNPIEGGIRLVSAGQSSLVSLPIIRAAAWLCTVIFVAWSDDNPRPFTEKKSSQLNPDFRFLVTQKAPALHTTQLYGYVGISVMERLLQDTADSDSENWNGPLSFEYFAGADTRLEHTLGVVRFDAGHWSNLHSTPLPLSVAANQSVSSAGQNSTGLMTSASSNTTLELESDGTLGGVLIVDARVIEAATEPMSHHTYVSLIFDALRGHIWQNHDHADAVVPDFPFLQDVELSTASGISLYARILDDKLAAGSKHPPDYLTWGDMQMALRALMQRTPTDMIGLSTVRCRRASGIVNEDFLELYFSRGPHAQEVAGTMNQTVNGTADGINLKQTMPLAQLENNKPVIAS